MRGFNIWGGGLLSLFPLTCGGGGANAFFFASFCISRMRSFFAFFFAFFLHLFCLQFSCFVANHGQMFTMMLLLILTTPLS